jgi:hypothetical protein
MTGRPAPYGVPDSALAGEEPEVAPAGLGDAPRRQCARCGAVGTHYLTCPDLRLPPGYRLGDAPRASGHS